MEDNSRSRLRNFWQKTWQEEKSIRDMIYDNSTSVSVIDSKQLRYIKTYVPSGSTVCEAGCGSCQWVVYLNIIGYRCFAFDYVFSGLHKSMVEYKVDKICQADLLNIPFKKNIFDAVLSWGVVEHLEDKTEIKQSILNMYNILKADGILFISVPYNNLFLRVKKKIRNVLFSTPYINKILFKKNILHDKPLFFQHYFNRKELVSLLQQSGFEVIKLDFIWTLKETIIFGYQKCDSTEKFARLKWNLYRMLVAMLSNIPPITALMILCICKKTNRCYNKDINEKENF